MQTLRHAYLTQNVNVVAASYIIPYISFGGGFILMYILLTKPAPTISGNNPIVT